LVLLGLGIYACCTPAWAQTATTVTTTKGAFSEFVPGSETLVIKSNTNQAPVQYVVTKATTVVDETGAPVAINQLALGAPLSVQYTEDGNRLVASRVVVEHAPIAATGTNVIHQETTTTTTRPLTHDEREALKDREEHRKEALKKEIERRKDALDKAKDALDDHGGD
jgi:type IV secretory pathway VirJ component